MRSGIRKRPLRIKSFMAVIRPIRSEWPNPSSKTNYPISMINLRLMFQILMKTGINNKSSDHIRSLIFIVHKLKKPNNS
jgi:hypothetical protein